MCFVIAANFHMDGRTSKATAFKNYFTNNISIFVSRHLKNEKKKWSSVQGRQIWYTALYNSNISLNFICSRFFCMLSTQNEQSVSQFMFGKLSQAKSWEGLGFEGGSNLKGSVWVCLLQEK